MLKHRRMFYILTAAAVLAIILTGCSSKEGETFKVFDKSSGIVYQGMIEAKEVSINSKIPGRIVKLHVKEGTEVKAGDLLVEISSDELRAKEAQMVALVESAKAAYDAARGQVKAANALLQKAVNGAREQEVAQAKAYYELMVKTYDRVERLYEKGAVSEQKRDEVKTQMEIARQKYDMAEEGARSEDISSAEALLYQAKAMEQAAKEKVEQAKAGLEEVRAYLKDTKITSPINGVVTELNSDEGELVSTGMSIATVTDLENVWIEVNVKENELDKITLGQEVNIKVPAFSQEVFKGKVVRINKKPDFAVKRATNDNGSFDVVSFGVKIDIDDKGKTLRPGMTAFVQFPY
ncbi:MAG: HlyD family secretion protein [Thermosediminibacterales bacterium]|nr:HlyD family secretion protein [Thermosediminibacterales bacterium]MDK2835624.1 HlyD family secretion protein [Thermosediminibacterales bacterium]